ncbi:MAG: ABC transporter permease [Chitinophagaceae bacterium]|nr:ABC transporter permease [Chitinophagaceae bacterium]
MAVRDSRRSRARLLLFISSIILGIAVLVAIYSLSDNLEKNIDGQAAELLGADLQISANRTLATSGKALVDSLGDARSTEQRFASMVLFSKTGGTRLVQVRALEGGFPYYGELETSPATAGRAFMKAQQALVDQTLMLQYNARVGDSIRVGELSFAIAGILKKAPGQTGISMSVAPSVYIPLRYLDQTGLSQRGSRINFRYYFKFNNPREVATVVKQIESRLKEEDLDYDTIETQKEATGRSFKDLTKFLALVGFIALLLGCVGVASAIHVYIREKMDLIAILRCIGMKASQAFLIYLIQITGIGFVGALIGAAAGTIIQQFLPFVIKDFLPIELTTEISWPSVVQGIALGTIISILFALLPLASIRKISPLNALRVSYEPVRKKADPLRWIVYTLIILFILAFSFLQMKNILQASVFTAGILAAFLVLTGIAKLLMWTIRRFFPSSWSYLWRQGLANLYRPNNQTATLIVSIGLSTAFICTLFFIQGILINRVTISTSANQPNIVLFDIQQKQREGLIALAKQFNLPAKETVPIVNMRLEKVNGYSQAAALKDTAQQMQRSLFSREYRVTFRDSLTSSETVVKGSWTGTADPGAGLPGVSLEKSFADRNNIDIGDTMVFNVQGALMPVTVNSLRKVNWSGMQTNFLVLFPKGVLENAPQFHVLLTHVPSQQVSARFQQQVARQYPNISVIDLGLVLKVLDDLLSKIGSVIRFMAGFSIATGIVVLIASVLTSKYQRLQESVLLRTLGASRKQIFAITALEYMFLGTMAAATGIVLAMTASWALARYTFDTEFRPDLLPILYILLSVSLVTVLIGLINSRGILSRSPLETGRR